MKMNGRSISVENYNVTNTRETISKTSIKKINFKNFISYQICHTPQSKRGSVFQSFSTINVLFFYFGFNCKIIVQPRMLL